MNEPQRHELD